MSSSESLPRQGGRRSGARVRAAAGTLVMAHLHGRIDRRTAEGAR